MCQIVQAVVKYDQKNVARLIEVKLSTGEVVAYTFPVKSVAAGPFGLFGRVAVLEPLAPSTYEECLFGSALVSGGAS